MDKNINIFTKMGENAIALGESISGNDKSGNRSIYCFAKALSPINDILFSFSIKRKNIYSSYSTSRP